MFGEFLTFASPIKSFNIGNLENENETINDIKYFRYNIGYEPMKEIDKIEFALNEILDITKIIKENVADGFQIKDILIIPEIFSKTFGLENAIKEAVIQKINLGIEETNYLINKFVSKAISIFYVDNDVNEYGIEYMSLLINNLGNIVDEIIGAIKSNGIGLDDAARVIPIVSNIGSIVVMSGNIVKEANDLSVKEIGELFGVLAVRVLNIIK
jgi:hypothetical protein